MNIKQLMVFLWLTTCTSPFAMAADNATNKPNMGGPNSYCRKILGNWTLHDARYTFPPDGSTSISSVSIRFETDKVTFGSGSAIQKTSNASCTENNGVATYHVVWRAAEGANESNWFPLKFLSQDLQVTLSEDGSSAQFMARPPGDKVAQYGTGGLKRNAEPQPTARKLQPRIERSRAEPTEEESSGISRSFSYKGIRE